MNRVKDRMPAWLYCVCRNRAFDIRKKEKRTRRFYEGELGWIPHSGADPSARAEREDNRRTYGYRRGFIELVEKAARCTD